MKSYGICPASCGEFVQGILDENKEYLCSYAVNMYSTVKVEEKLKNIDIGPKKSRRAIEKVFEKFNLPVKETKNISLNICSNIPIGKGMASSTADIGATIKATLCLIDKSLTNEEISVLAAEIEPTDSIFIEEGNVFNPLNGKVKKNLGNITNSRVVVLEPNRTLDTIELRKISNYNELKLKNADITKEAFQLLEQGIKNNDLTMVGNACTMSSLANESIVKKQYLREIIEISKQYGAYGVNIAHSGTVIGILIDQFMNDRRLIEILTEKKINLAYNNIYTLDIVHGGIRGEKDGIHKKSYEDRRKKL